MRTTRIAISALYLIGCAVLAGLCGCGGSSYSSLSSNVSLTQVAFMGDSITSFWSLPVVNLGVPGNTTSLMLARFPDEVTGHGYQIVVILGGINDLTHNQTPEEALANITKMAQAARSAQIDVVLCELTPDFQENDGYDSAVRALNASIVQLATAQHYTLVDYYDPMAGHPEYFKDGLHPTDAGYAVMAQALLPTLTRLEEK